MYNNQNQPNNVNMYYQPVPNQNTQSTGQFNHYGNNQGYNNQQGYVPPQSYNPQPQQYPVAAVSPNDAVHHHPPSDRPILSRNMKYFLIGMSMVCFIICFVVFFILKK